jgi:TatD DNase family protein
MDMVRWLDAHTHLDSSEMFPEVGSLLRRAEQAGVRRMVLVNSEATRESFERTMSLADPKATVQRFLSLGVHPHNAAQYGPDVERQLLLDLQHPAVVAFGEIGLDFYYNFSPPEVQESVFRRQLELALEVRLPVVIHCRDAYGRLVEILLGIAPVWKGLIHCFTGDADEASQLLALGFHISFAGIVTFKNASSLREAAQSVPLSRMLIETDAPYLAPVPYRGRRNEPAYVVETGRFLARLRDLPEEAFAESINRNFQDLFRPTPSMLRG